MKLQTKAAATLLAVCLTLTGCSANTNPKQSAETAAENSSSSAMATAEAQTPGESSRPASSEPNESSKPAATNPVHYSGTAAKNPGAGSQTTSKAANSSKAPAKTPGGSQKTPAAVSANLLVLETPAGAVLVGKIKRDSTGWYFETEQPITVKLTCYVDQILSYENLKRIEMFADAEDGTSKELFRDDTVTVTGMLQNYRDMDSLYLYPCKIERGKTVRKSHAAPELDYPAEEPAEYDPTAPLPTGMQPVMKNGCYEYNPYILTVNTLEYLGNDFAYFYRDFVEAWLSYKTSCPCASKNYAEMFSSVMFYEFPLFSVDGEFDLQSGYNEATKTLTWRYKTKSKAEHNKLIADFTAAANRFLNQVKAADSEQLRAQALYHAFCTSMTYDYAIMTSRERIDAYYAYTLHRGVCVTFACALSQLFAQIGVKATVAAGDTADGSGHVWNVVTLNGSNYFCDSTFELFYNSGKGFVYFGMTMEDRLNDSSGFTEKNMVIGALNVKTVDEVDICKRTLQIK